LLQGSRKISIVEVGPRDGLQNETRILSVSDKVELIEALVDAGLRSIEVGSFVSSKHVPQMANTVEVLSCLRRRKEISYSVLVPNKKGLEAAQKAGVDRIAVFASASESFSQHNIGCSIAESLNRYREVVRDAVASGMTVRGYVSCVLGCPYEGPIATEAVSRVTQALLAMGCDEVSLGDTIGAGNVQTTETLLAELVNCTSVSKLAVHFHDTNGCALENIRVALAAGINVIDSSIAGLGGCPFAPGAPGNVSTEAVVSVCADLGFETGVDREKLAAASRLARAKIN
jgi:hydroxymethylglutaryl-CoA lyase